MDRRYQKQGRPDRRFDKPGSSNKPYNNPNKPYNKKGFDQKKLEDSARRVVLDALSAVTQAKAYAQLALSDQLRKSTISPEDKRLATNIFYSTLENLIRIDYVLAQLIERMPDAYTRDILRMAVAQMLFMDRLPDHAIVDQAVKQTKKGGRDGFAGVVNGTLRNLIRRRDAGEIAYPNPEEDPVLYLSVMNSVPEHIVRRLIEQYGEAFAREILEYKADERVETLRTNYTLMDADAFLTYAEKRKWVYEKTELPGVITVKGAGDLTADYDFQKGLFSVQGIGSMLSALALEPSGAKHYLDACAAPGGKTALIAEKMGGSGRVQAWDIRPHRVELIQATVKRLRLDNVRAMERDARTDREELHGTFDGVLIDAPCSGLGVMLNKPDIKYRVTEEDFASLPTVQSELLNACAKYVAPGGLLVYSTCTIIAEENERQIEAFLRAHPEFEPERSNTFLPERLRDNYRDGMIQLHAHRDHAEGFFIARLRRRRA